MVTKPEIDRRYKNIREAMANERLDALVVCGNEYTGFEGAIRYVSGFEIVHRYVYALIPLEGDLTLEGRQSNGPGLVHHIRFGIQVMENLFGGAQSLLVRVADAR